MPRLASERWRFAHAMGAARVNQPKWITNMNTSDAKLTELVKMQMAGARLPENIVVDRKSIDTRRFVARYQLDRREAWAAISQLVEHVIERPLVCEVAGSLSL